MRETVRESGRRDAPGRLPLEELKSEVFVPLSEMRLSSMVNVQEHVDFAKKNEVLIIQAEI